MPDQRNLTKVSNLAIEVLIAASGNELKKIILTRKVAFVGRPLITAGGRGITRKDFPGFHLAHYIQMMREAGLNIDTQMEENTSAWGGKHARYKLLDEATFREIPMPKRRKKKPTSAATERASLSDNQSSRLVGSNE